MSSTRSVPKPPPLPPRHITPTLYNTLLRERSRAKQQFLSFLCTTKRPESPSSALNEHEESGIVKKIFSFVVGNIGYYPNEGCCNYKVKFQMCHGTEHCFVEALYNKGGWMNDNHGGDFNRDEFCGSMSSRTLGLPLHEEVIHELAELRNVDGSYFTEGQLRSYWRENFTHDCRGMTPCMVNGPLARMGAAAHLHRDLPADFFACEYCDGTSPVREVQSDGGRSGIHHFACDSRCMALPGDTIYWRFLEPYRIAGRWETATDEELVERGYVDFASGRRGQLYVLCQSYREEQAAEDIGGEDVEDDA